MMNKLLLAASLGEAAFGIFIFVLPSLGFSLLFGGEPAASAIIMIRVAGIALVGLGIACYPPGTRRGLYGMLAYGVLVAIYLAVVGINGSVGVLLWPAVALHAALSVSLIVAARAGLSKLP